MELDIIYKDKDILVLNKPAGIVVHPDKNHAEDTLIQAVVKKYPEVKGVGEDQARPGVVHRLDKDTSGILVVACSQNAFDYLKSVFQKREIKKTYLVLVSGIVKDDSGVIDFPIGRSRKDSRRRIAGKGASGKLREAKTEYKVVKRFRDFTLLEARPLTGRTHQIRAHFAAISRPVACDRIYGGKNPACPAGLNRQFLHAWKLEFVSPSGAKMSFEADLPEDLEKVLEELK
ncbi:MAG: RluA family pseudouridine synthase [Candidatus Niyogibacteria bacterium]|nr:RluA family pseudouridine synthase [Candidatus Niyogibacteria bacterium]